MTPRIGVQTPRLQHLPPGSVRSPAAQDVIEIAALAGLKLDPWQCWVLENALAENDDGKWAAFEAALVVPRQCGKSALLAAIILAALFVWGERTVIYSAHRFDTAQETFNLLRSLLDPMTCPELAAEVATVYTANGKESIILNNGCRVKFKARSRGSGQGFSGDRIIFDEAWNLAPSSLSSLIPTMAARSMLPKSNPQIWYASSAPHSDSEVLHQLRRRCIAGNAGRLFFAEWSCEVGVDPLDRDAWAQANPALGIRISEDFIFDEWNALKASPEEFMRERLGVVPPSDGGSTILTGWEACRGSRSELDAKPSHVAVTVGPSGGWSSVVAVGKRVDGTPYVEVIRRDAGTSWVVAEALAAHQATGNPIVVDPKSPTAGVIPDLIAATVKLTEVSTADYVAACAAMQVDVANGRLVHFGDSVLDAAVVGADIRPVGESWAWSQKASTVDITPLVAATLALWASRQGPPAFFIY